MNFNSKNILDILIRYAFLLVLAIPNLYLIYLIFTPLTIYPVYFLINLFFDFSLLSPNILLIGQEISIELISACIAGSAYYFLLILNLSTPKIKLNKRIKMLAIALLSFLVLNIIRISSLIFLFVFDSNIFNATHIIFWYGISTLFVVLIWFSEVKYFKIREIPIYSDIKFIFNFGFNTTPAKLKRQKNSKNLPKQFRRYFLQIFSLLAVEFFFIYKNIKW